MQTFRSQNGCKSVANYQSTPRSLPNYNLLHSNNVAPSEEQRYLDKQEMERNNFRFESLNCSPKRRFRAEHPAAFATVPRVNFSFSPEKILSPPSQFHTVSRSHCLCEEEVSEFPPLSNVLKSLKNDSLSQFTDQSVDHSKFSDFELKKTEGQNPYALLSSFEDTPPLLKKSAV